MNRYRSDPYWLIAKFNGICCECGRKIKTGDRAFYYPVGKRIFCAAEKCGHRLHAEFAAAAEDEALFRGA